MFIELGADRISAHYPDWTSQVDQDVSAEKGAHRMDVFTQPMGDDAFRAVVVDHKFQSYAARIWESVRPELASVTERRAAQHRFEDSLVFAHQLLAEFTNALNDQKMTWEIVGNRAEIFYKDPNGERHRILLNAVSPANLSLSSLQLEDDDGMHVFISDPALLKPLRASLEALLRWQIAANARLARR